MSHAFKADNGTTFWFNADLSGYVTVRNPSSGEQRINASDLLQFMAERFRAEKLSRLEAYDWQFFVGDYGRQYQGE